MIVNLYFDNLFYRHLLLSVVLTQGQEYRVLSEDQTHNSGTMIDKTCLINVIP